MDRLRRTRHVLSQGLSPFASGNPQDRASTADLIPRARLTAGNTLQVLNIVSIQF